jgi:hypothetical protein
MLSYILFISNIMLNKKFLNIAISVLLLTSSGLVLFQGCQDEPGNLGLEFILSDTLGTKILDSSKDTIIFTNNNFRKYINTSSAPYLFVGYYQSYQSTGLLRFRGLSANYAGGTVLAAYIKMTYGKYAFEDTLGTVSFNVYSLNKYHDFTQITLDSFSTSELGTNVLASYSGSINDTNRFTVPFDNLTAQGWLNYAADTSTAVKNYGIALVPNSSCNTIKGFYTYRSVYPSLTTTMMIVVNKNNITDTLVYESDFASLSDAPYSILMPDRFTLSNGVCFNNILNFSISKLPGKVIINEAILQFKLDYNNSFITTGTDKRIQVSLVTDSSQKLTDGGAFFTTLLDSVTYQVRINSIAQRWNYLTAPNYGVMLLNTYNALTLDKFVFYSSTVADTTLRPKLLIRYTTRE